MRDVITTIEHIIIGKVNIIKMLVLTVVYTTPVSVFRLALRVLASSPWWLNLDFILKSASKWLSAQSSMIVALQTASTGNFADSPVV